jgi:hypothetical protein
MNTKENSTRGGSLLPSHPVGSGRDHPDEDPREHTLDQTIEDTFPASDPPSSIPDPDTPSPESRKRGPRR